MQEFGKSKLSIPLPKPVGFDNTYKNTDRLHHIDEHVLPEPDNGGIHARAATIEDTLDHIHLAMKGIQAYWMPVSKLNPWIIYFPYVWYLEKETRIYNRTTGAEYAIDSFDPKIGENVVRLISASGALPPADGDIFELDQTVGKHLKFQHAYPNSDDVNRYVTPEEIEKNMIDGFTDTISYKIDKIEPATINRTQQLSPRRMQEIPVVETGDIREVFMELFDSEFTFQCWTKTMERTARLARWFRTFMRIYRSTFQLNGVQQIVFMRQSQEYNVTRWRNDIVGSTLMYSVRSQEIYESSNVMLKNFSANVEVLGGHGESVGFKTNIETE